MSPLQLETLLHFYRLESNRTWIAAYTSTDEGVNDLREAANFLLSNGMLRDRFIGIPNSVGETKYELTEKGRFYIEYIFSLPLPVEKTVYSIETKD